MNNELIRTFSAADRSSTRQQRQQISKDRKRKVESDITSEDTKTSEQVTSKRRSRSEDNSNKTSAAGTPSNLQNTCKPESSPSRVSPRITPSKEKVKPQRTREIDKESRNNNNNNSVQTDIKKDTNANVKANGPVTLEISESTLSKTKVRSRQKKEVSDTATESVESPKSRTESPRTQSRTETPRTRHESPRSPRTCTQTQEAEAVIKSNSNSGSKKEKRSDSRKVNKSAKSDTNSDAKLNPISVKPESPIKSSNKSSVKDKTVTNTSKDTSDTNKSETDLVEQKLKEIKSAFESRKSDKNGEKVIRTRDSKSDLGVEKQTKKRERKKKDKNTNISQVESVKCAKTVSTKEVADNGNVKGKINEAVDNMHYIKKKQSLLSGGTSQGLAHNSGLSSSNIDFNQSVTDQIARAEKLSGLSSEEKSGSVSSALSSPVSGTEHDNHDFPSHPNSKHIPNSLSSSLNTNTNSSWSQEERSQSRNSEDRCSSGFSDDLRRPGSRVDELRSSKISPASSPLIVDKSEPVTIYRDPELMSKNPVRSNVPGSMHNSHKSYPPIHNPIPTQASRPSSVGMTSTPLSSSMERTRTPVIPSVAYPSPLPLGAGLPGATLSGLLPPGLHQLDPATLAMHQQVAALQQQHVSAVLASQYRDALSMSYPPRGTLNSAQLEHLWQQKYPSVPVPPPWLLAKHQDDLIRDVRLLHEQEAIEARERHERIERERDLREREQQRERKERERRDRERQEKERLDRYVKSYCYVLIYPNILQKKKIKVRKADVTTLKLSPKHKDF